MKDPNDDVLEETEKKEVEATTNDNTAQDATEEDDVAVCWICAEPVKYYSVPECNHRTCHVCSLRLRALYKKMECTFCKVRTACILCSVKYSRFLIAHGSRICA